MNKKSGIISAEKRELKKLLDQWGKKTGSKNLTFLKKKIKKFKHKKRNKPYTWEHFLVFAQKKGILDKLKNKKKIVVKDKKSKVKPFRYIMLFVGFIIITGIIIFIGYWGGKANWRVSNLFDNRLFSNEGDNNEKFSKKWLENQIFLNSPLLFKFDSIDLLNSDEEQKLTAIITALKNYNSVELRLEGHSHSIGNPDSEKELALQRTQFIKNKLESVDNIDLVILTVSFGSNKQVADGDKHKKRHLNRRVEIEVLKAE